MKNLSRREFLRQFKDGILDQVDTKKFRPVFPAVLNQAKNQKENWVEFGKTFQFPPGSSHLHRIGRQAIPLVVVSHGEGLQVYNLNPFLTAPAPSSLPIRMDRTGTLAVDLNGTWPAGSVFSLLTESRAELEIGEEK